MGRLWAVRGREGGEGKGAARPPPPPDPWANRRATHMGTTTCPVSFRVLTFRETAKGVGYIPVQSPVWVVIFKNTEFSYFSKKMKFSNWNETKRRLTKPGRLGTHYGLAGSGPAPRWG